MTLAVQFDPVELYFAQLRFPSFFSGAAGSQGRWLSPMKLS